VVSEEELSGGDFVRNIKQLIDLLRQIAEVAPDAATRSTAAAASEALFRGVVAASSTVGDGTEDAADDAEAHLAEAPPAGVRPAGAARPGGA
jgi:hypothetical protein